MKTRKRQPKMNVVHKSFSLLPCAPDVCQECAVKHAPELPHNQQSLYWQYKFQSAQGRWPTWSDAMAHCTPEMKAHWVQELAKHGVNVLVAPGANE